MIHHQCPLLSLFQPQLDNYSLALLTHRASESVEHVEGGGELDHSKAK